MFHSPLSCDKINQLLVMLRDDTRLRIVGAEPIRIGPIFDIIDALNQHVCIIATALTEISQHEPGAISTPTFQQLARILKQD